MAEQFGPRVQAQAEFAVVDFGHHTKAGGDIEIVIEEVRHRWCGTLSAAPRSPPVVTRAEGDAAGPAVMRWGPIPDKVGAMDPIDVDAFEALVADALEGDPRSAARRNGKRRHHHR